METDITPSQELKCPISSVPKLIVEPKEEKGSGNVLWCEDKKYADLYLKYDEKESSSKEEFIESALIGRTKDEMEQLNDMNLDLCLGESYIKRETKSLNEMQVGSNDRSIDKKFDNDSMEPCAIKQETNDDEELYYSHESSSKSEVTEPEEVQIKHEEEISNDLKRIVDKEFDNDSNIVMEPSAIKKEVNTEELNYDSECSFQPETTRQEEAQIKSKEDENEKLNKKIRKCGKPLMLYQCPECPYNTNRKGVLKSHSLRHKRTDETNWYSCQDCPYRTFWKASLKRHVEIHSNLILKCSKCSYKTSAAVNLKKHQRIHSTNIQWLHCSECSFKAYKPSVFRNHVLAHKSDAFKCPKCLFQSRTKSQLTTHLVKHESVDRWHSCPLCPFKHYNKATLKAHCQRRHSTDLKNPKQIEIFKCSECVYESGCKYYVRTHQLIHDRSNWFQCPNCTYKTAYKRNFKQHQMRHHEENVRDWHMCSECSYKTTSSHNLLCHVLSHNTSADKIWWFECSQCSYKTPYRHQLERHQLKHKDAHEIEWFCCYECSFKTEHKSSLIVHISKHKKRDRLKLLFTK